MKTSQEELSKELTFTRFDQMSQRYPQNTAVIYLGQRYSYAHLSEMSERFAASLKELGIEKGDKVIIYLSNSIQWVIAFLAIQKAGAVIVPVSPIYTSYELEYMIKDSGAETVICLDTNFGYVQEVYGKTDLKRGCHQSGRPASSLEEVCRLSL